MNNKIVCDLPKRVEEKTQGRNHAVLFFLKNFHRVRIVMSTNGTATSFGHTLSVYDNPYRTTLPTNQVDLGRSGKSRSTSQTLADSRSSMHSTTPMLNQCDAAAPPVIIHRYDVGLRLLQGLVIVWLLSGFSFITCVSLCILVNVGYVSFKSEGLYSVDLRNIILSLGYFTFILIGFVFYSWLIFKLYRSLALTFVRMCIRTWRERFGAGERDFWPLRWIDPFANWLQQNWCSYMDDDRHQMVVDCTKTLILFLLMSAVIGFPLIYTASVYGYWVVINVMCVFLVLGSSAAIVLTNLLARFIRFLKFLYLTPSKMSSAEGYRVSPRLRAAFLASCGFDTNQNIVHVVCEQVMIISLVILMCSLIFNGLIPNWIIIGTTLSLMAFFGLIRLRRFFPCYVRRVTGGTDDIHSVDFDAGEGQVPARTRGFMSSVMSGLEWEGHQRGTLWQPVIMVILIRTICFALGFASLLVFDLSSVGTPTGTSPSALPYDEAVQLILCATAFLLCTFCRDIAFVMPMGPEKVSRYLRPLSLFLFQLGQVAFSVLGSIYFSGFTFIAAIIVSIYILDYREARFYWSITHTKTRPCRRRVRATRHIFLTLFLLLFFVLFSLIIGLAVGSTRDVLKLAPQTSDELANQHESLVGYYNGTGFSSPLCSMRFAEEKLTVTDLGIMSEAIYKRNRSEALTHLHGPNNTRLSDWTIRKCNFGSSRFGKDFNDEECENEMKDIVMTSGVRFAEFVHNDKNLSVIAIRGTFNVEDVFQDLYMWSTVALLQTSSYFGTLINLWPMDTVSYVVYWISVYASFPNLIYYSEMEKIVADIAHQNAQFKRRQERNLLWGFLPVFSTSKAPLEVGGNSNVLLTGHSLGGGLANIIAGHLNVPSVVFSAPGLGYSTKTYNLRVESVMANTMNVVPMNDPVPRTDKQISMIQNVPCTAGQPLMCHHLGRTIKTIKEICERR